MVCLCFAGAVESPWLLTTGLCWSSGSMGYSLCIEPEKGYGELCDRILIFLKWCLEAHR